MLDVKKIKRKLSAGAMDSNVVSNIIVELTHEINRLNKEIDDLKARQPEEKAEELPLKPEMLEPIAEEQLEEKEEEK